MEKLVDTVSAIRPDHAAVFAFGMLLDDVAIFPEKSAWLCDFNGLVQAFSRSLGDPYGVWICQCFVSNIVGLVQVRVETAVVDRDIDVEDVSVFQYSLIGNAVADDLVKRRANGLWEIAVVEG